MLVCNDICFTLGFGLLWFFAVQGPFSGVERLCASGFGACGLVFSELSWVLLQFTQSAPLCDRYNSGCFGASGLVLSELSRVLLQFTQPAPVCDRYNSGSCKRRGQRKCRFRHVCSICLGEHPAHSCCSRTQCKVS
mmetsp:Transcript_129363/g.295171  ORF Transcript_129363/g.295171 Transcript_129363/m.295171 type:complete len:136 (+) Transcript_129363:55-462(+)